MGIVKIKLQGLDNSIHVRSSSSSALEQNELVHEEKLILHRAPVDFFDDDQLEVGYECVMVGGQTCSVPYELFDLPDLKEILSLETWNDCLTEDDRFSLAAFLPGMVQETFWITVKKLLSGDVMFFDSPLEKFYTGMKGGFYYPQVTLLRESLRLFQRREYYHCLRSHHESMTQKFVDMKMLWNKHQATHSVEERIHIWNNRRHHKPVLLVDLNAYPDDDAIINKKEKNMEAVSFLKKTKHLYDNPESDVSLISVLSNNKPKAKGILKIKPVEMNSVQNHVLQPFTTETVEPTKRAPKGVLKIKPKCDSTDQSIARKTREIISADLLRIRPPKISNKYIFQREDYGMPEKLPSLYQIERDVRTNRNPELVHEQQREDLLTRGAVSLNSSQKCETQLKLMKGTKSQDDTKLYENMFPLKVNPLLRNYSHEVGKTGKRHTGKGLGKHPKSQDGSFTYVSSKCPKPESFRGGLETYQEMQANNANSETSLRVSSNSTNKHKLRSDNSNYLNRGLDNPTVGLPTSSVCVIDPVVDADLKLPITYKRKKPSMTLDPVEPLKQQSVAVVQPVNFSGTLSMKPKSIKIKFKGLTGYNS